MLQRSKKIIRQSILGGLLVVLPVTILLMVFRWLFDAITNLIQPLTNLLIQVTGLPEFVGDVIVIATLIMACFLIGSIVSTSAGRWLHTRFDGYLMSLAPGYRLVKDIVNQFLGDASQSPFANGEVARVYLFSGETSSSVTAIVTSRHPNGDITVFVPTGPNPTSGNIFHVKPEQVEILSHIKVEEAFRTIIACGAGSGAILEKQI